MHVSRMFDVGLCRCKAENSTRVGSFVCQANIDEPIEDAVEGYPIHYGERLLAQ
jgi:hypothetical protein